MNSDGIYCGPIVMQFGFTMIMFLPKISS